MASPRLAEQPGRLERDCIRLCIATLEKRARKGHRVEISDRLALVIAKHLRRLLERG